MALEPDLLAELVRLRVEAGYSVVFGDPVCVYAVLADVGERSGGGFEVLADTGSDVFAAVRTELLAGVLDLDVDPLREAAFVLVEESDRGGCRYSYVAGERDILGREFAREIGMSLSAERIFKALQNRFT